MSGGRPLPSVTRSRPLFGTEVAPCFALARVVVEQQQGKVVTACGV